MSIVFIDTQIMIWAILGQAKESQKFLVPKAKHLISDLERQKADLYISSVTLAEMFCGVPKSTHNAIRKEIQRHIKVAPFDSLAAKHYGKIWRETKADGLYDALTEMGMVRKQFNSSLKNPFFCVSTDSFAD